MESFKRQIDLEESIWRSVPLFTGGLIAAGAIVTGTARALPEFKCDIYHVFAYAFLALAVIAFSVSFWWLWQVVKPREFDYPADDEAISRYALDMTAYHRSQRLSGDSLDNEVVRELHSYMATTFATAAKSTFGNNQSRLSARGQVLIFLLSGFMLAFASDATIFGHQLLFGAELAGKG